MRAGPFGVGWVPATDEVKSSRIRTALREFHVSDAAALYALTLRTVTLSVPVALVLAVVSDQLSPTLRPALIHGKKSLSSPWICTAAGLARTGSNPDGFPDFSTNP